MTSLRKPRRPRLIDDSALAIGRDRSRSVERKQDGWFRSEVHLAWIRTLPCILAILDTGACGGEIEAAHVRIGTDGAMGEKPSDVFATPQCQSHHRLSHMIGERSFWGPNTDAADFALKLACKSPCAKTRAAAAAELQRRTQ